MKIFLYSLLFILSLPFFAISQNTIGLISYNDSLSFDGYNLMYPHNQSSVFLIDNCGEIVHKWEGEDDDRPGNTVYILENGDLLKTKRDNSFQDDPIWAGGGGAIVERRTWDNQLIWEFELNDSTARLHHDIAILPSGNVLMIAWENKTSQESIEAGRNPDLLSQGKLWPDVIFEYNPQLDSMVWEWHAWDHLIQDFDETKENYGIVSDHPELINLNWDTHDGHNDWMHTNAINYNPVLDHIAISVPYFNEIWIIDHSTSSLDAAGHSGGNSNKGGDLLYRWGNPAAYNLGDSSDQKLFFQHDINWTNPNVPFHHPDFNKMILFNNRVSPTFSTSNIFTPIFDTITNQYILNANQPYGPSDFERTISHPTNFFKASSNSVSSAQVLPNGNTLICSGRWGYAYEITPNDSIVWEYIVPFSNGQPATQNSIHTINQNFTFRLKRYHTSYSAFDGKDLSPQGYIELEPNESFCTGSPVAIQTISNSNSIKISPNPTNNFITIDSPIQNKKFNLEIYNLQGQLFFEKNNVKHGDQLNIDFLPNGIYFITDKDKSWYIRFLKL